jgi:deazaflavin-dependent oxidoreductase (nitroreductase family)
MDWASWHLGFTLWLGHFARWLYRGQRQNALARVLNRAVAAVFARGVAPNYLVTLQVTGRRSGRTISLPLVIIVLDGQRYLVSNLGADVAWVKNVKAAGGRAVLRHGRTEEVRLDEIPAEERAPMLKALLRRAPGARPHIPVDKDAPLAEFAAVAARFPVFRIRSAAPATSTAGGERGPLRVGIVGGGPSGSALAILLSVLGADVTLFSDGRRPPLLVGESLIPAVVPILRRLDVESDVARFSRVKPGASFVWSGADRVSVVFNRFAPDVFPYAYNIPRPRFDEALLDRAVAAGARHVPVRAVLQRGDGHGPGAELALARETLAAAPALQGRQPHLIVDATGRARHGARALKIPARVGPRKDVAHFAHFEGFRWEDPPGQVLVTRARAGWSWCIPLQDCLSIGIVLGEDDAAELGPTPEERLARAIETDPGLASIAGGAHRVTPVATYANYQLVSERGHGRGWVMAGDAFGFVDPMLSPGVFLALRSAELIADGLAPWVGRREIPPPAELDRAMAAYAREQDAMLSAWQELIDYFYDGRVAALMRSGRTWRPLGTGFFRSAMDGHVARHVGLMACGASTTGRYCRALLRFLSRYGLRGVDPARLAIR